MNIFEAIYNNDVNKVKEFLDSDLDVNIQDNDLETPLYIACNYIKVEIVELLLKHPNINVNLQNEYGMTPLYHACRWDYRKVVKLLLEHSDIDVNLQDNRDDTPLYVACEYTNIEIAKLLLTHLDIKINFNITEFKNKVKLYLYIKRKQNTNLDKVNKILDMIED